MNKWKDSSLTLGERCVAFAEQELANGVCEDKLNSFTSPRLREYFSICTRLVNGKETYLNLNSCNWCSSSMGFCLRESLLPGETPPHGYRYGVVEVVSDLQKKGLYHPASHVRNGQYKIKVGDPVIFDRSNPSNPASAWWRHIGRVHSITNNNEFKCISGNAGGKWKISNHKLSQANLLGFGEYPSATTIVQSVSNVSNIDWSKFSDLDLAPTEDTGKYLDAGVFFDVFGGLFSTNKKD